MDFSKLHNKNVLVTGGGGFIGSHLSERLVTLGAKTRALIHYNAQGSRGWLEKSPLGNEIECVFGDTRDRDFMLEAVQNIDIIFHLAALISIPYSYHSPSSYIETNIMGTLNTLQAARANNVQLFIHTSTSEVYGTAQYVPIDEKHPLHAQSPYAASKIGADKMVEAFHLSYGLPVITLRPFNTFGPRQSTRAIIPTIITQCLTGDRVKLGNLSPTRDLNFISNTVEGFLCAACRPEAVGDTLNLGSGREISIHDLVLLIGNLMEREIVIDTEPTRLRPKTSEVERLLAENHLAKEKLGWTPIVGLEEGLGQTIRWIKENVNLFSSTSYRY